MKTEKLLTIFTGDVWTPANYTDCYWRRTSWGIEWSDEGDNPDEWEDCYSSDRCRGQTEKSHFLLIELDDGCGETYQAFFDKNKEVEGD